jgi:ribonuclease D
LESRQTPVFEFIQTDLALKNLLEQIRESQTIALDTEADSFHHYYPKVCLIQGTVGSLNFIVDPLAGIELSEFFTLLSQKNLILHDAGYDLRMLKADFDFEPRGEIFDTMLAARLLGLEKVGLSALLSDFLGIQTQKHNQRADWSKRPLSDELLRYAIVDTHFLPALADLLTSKLDRMHRSQWHRQSCQWSVRSALHTKSLIDLESDDIWRISGVSRLNPKEMAFFRELWRWREKEAQKADIPPFRVMYSKQMLAISAWAAAQKNPLKTELTRLPRSCRGPRLTALKKSLEKAHLMPQDQWPARKKTDSSRQPAYEQQVQIEKLRSRVAQIAMSINLPPQFIAPKAILASIVLRKLNTLQKLLDSDLLSPWQAELLAPALEEVFGDKTKS